MKKFLIIGNSNAITQKSVFPHIASGEWLVRSSNNKIHLSMDFIDCDGNIKNIPSAWFTNIGIPSTNSLTLTKKYNPNDYPKYDNIDAINVNRIKDIPYDYNFVMAVPISIVLFTNQFEIVGALPRGGPINGRFTFKRILVKKKSFKKFDVFSNIELFIGNNDFKTNVFRMNSEQFLIWIGKNYEYQKEKLKKWCNHNKYVFDEDIFSDTIVKVYDYIEKHGLRDGTPTGVDNYFFISYKNNLKRDRQYSRVKNRVELPELNKCYEDYYNEHNDSSTIKVLKDLKQDFSALYLLRLVEDNFDNEHTYCFKLKFLYKLTYRELQQKTKIKNSRQKVIDVLHWLRVHVTKEDLENAFQEFKGNIL